MRPGDWPHPDLLDVRVFPNRSNRLAHDVQFFTPAGLRAIATREAAQFDIAHIHAHRHVLELVAARALRSAHVPYVSAPNGTAPRIERRRMMKRVWDACWGDADLRGADAVAAVSEAERRQLHSAGVLPGRVRLVPNPVDELEVVSPPDGRRYRRTWAPHDQPVVLFLGKLTPRKRLDVLCAAMPLLSSQAARLVIAGNDMGAGPSARAAVRRHGLGARTTFTGLLEGGDRLEALAAADVVVYPSADEIFGLVPLEALLCGTPVVVADDSGCGEIVATLDGGQVTPLGDPAALAQAVDHVLAAPEHWRARATRGGAMVRARFGSAGIAERYDALYHELLAR